MRNSFVYRFGVLSASGIALNALGFCYRMFLARTVGADGMGVYQLVLPFYSVLQSLTLTGLCTAVSALSARETPYGAKRVFRTASHIFLTLFTVILIVCTTFTDFLSGTLLGDVRTKTAVLLLLPCLLLTGFENLLKNYFYGVQTPRPPMISELTEQVVRFGSVAALFFTFRPQNAGSACALIVLGMVVSEVVSVILLSRFFRKQSASVSRVSVSRRAVLATAIPVTISAVLLNVLGAMNAVLIPRGLTSFGLSPTQATAQYGVLFGMTLPLLTLPLALLGALPAVLIPSLSAQFGAKNTAKARRYASKAFHITGLLAFPMFAMTCLFANQAMEIFYQQKIAEGVLLPLCLATFFAFYQLTGCAVLNGIGKTRHCAGILLISGVLQLIFTLYVSKFGVSAFLWGDVVSTAVCASLCYLTAKKTLTIRIRTKNWLFRPFVSSAISCLLARPLYLRLQADGIPFAIMIAGIVLAVSYLLTLRVMGTSLVSYLKPILKPKSPSQNLRAHPAPM